MREFLALFRSGWIAALSYRMNMLLSLVALPLTLVPVYFVAQALQPIAADSIQREGGHYVGFLISGLAVLALMQSALMSLPQAITSGIGSGTFEAILTTPARLPGILLGLVSYDWSWALIRAALMFVTALVMGVVVHPAQAPLALLALLLTLVTYFGMSLGLAAMILVFRTTGPVASGIVAASSLLGGAYFSTTVIPSWIQKLSVVTPLTYGLRAFRQALLGGFGLDEVGRDLVMISSFAAVCLGLGGLLFLMALTHARKQGSLGQY